jgi:hypothetical protein
MNGKKGPSAAGAVSYNGRFRANYYGTNAIYSGYDALIIVADRRKLPSLAARGAGAFGSFFSPVG